MTIKHVKRFQNINYHNKQSIFNHTGDCLSTVTHCILRAAQQETEHLLTIQNQHGTSTMKEEKYEE